MKTFEMACHFEGAEFKIGSSALTANIYNIFVRCTTAFVGASIEALRRGSRLSLAGTRMVCTPGPEVLVARRR